MFGYIQADCGAYCSESGLLQGEQSVGYGCLLPTIITLSNKLIKIQQKIEHPFSTIALELEKQLRKRFRAFFELNEEADLALAAAALIPNVKLSWLKILQKTSPQFTYTRITERVIRIITDYAIKQNLPATNENHKCEGSYTESTFYDFSDGGKFCISDTYTYMVFLVNQITFLQKKVLLHCQN